MAKNTQDKASTDTSTEAGSADQLNGPAQEALTANSGGDRIITTGALAKDDGVRTESGAHPMDPMFLGTKIADTASLQQAQEFRADREKKLEAAEAPLRQQPSAEKPAGEEQGSAA